MGSQAAAGFEGVSQLYGGVEANKQARKQAKIIEREAEEKAEAHAKNVSRFEASQKVGFLKSGVTLEGSPMLVLEDTRREGAKEVEAIRRTGRAQAESLRDQGRVALIQGILGGGASFSKAAGK